MARRILLTLFMALAVAGSACAAPKKITVESMPPVVVSTVPQSGDTAVSPKTTLIKVTFSKKMKTRDMWSWVKVSDDTFPAVTGRAGYMKDAKTCVLPVTLEPGKTYAIWINSGESNAFRDTGGNPAVPYLIVFQTAKK